MPLRPVPTGHDHEQVPIDAYDPPIEEQAAQAPPADEAVEKTVLASAIIDADALAVVVSQARPETFYHHKNRFVFEAIRELSAQNRPVDLVTLRAELLRLKTYDSVGGYYLADITSNVASTSNVEYHIRILLELESRRRLILGLTEIIGHSYDRSEDAFDALDEVNGLADEVRDGVFGSVASVSDMAKAGQDAIAEIDAAVERRRSGAPIIGVPSGLNSLDKITGGGHPGELITIAARPGMGKTVLSIDWLRSAAWAGHGVAYCTLEMPAAQLAKRVLSAEAEVDGKALRDGTVLSHDLEKVREAHERMKRLPIMFEDSMEGTPAGLRAFARKADSAFRRRGIADGLGLLIVDYLQLLHAEAGAGRRGMNREQEVAIISRSLKKIAMDMNCLVVADSQLSRAVENRPDKRPQLADLRESGAIEQDSDVVMFVYRPEKYGIDVFPTQTTRDSRGMAEIIVGKQRSGPTGSTFVRFVERYTRFEDEQPNLSAPPPSHPVYDTPPPEDDLPF